MAPAVIAIRRKSDRKYGTRSSGTAVVSIMPPRAAERRGASGASLGGGAADAGEIGDMGAVGAMGETGRLGARGPRAGPRRLCALIRFVFFAI